MNILVTGANGLLGQKLVGLLPNDSGILPIATARKKLNYPLPRGRFYELDITDADAVGKVISISKPEAIINAAAMTQVDQCETQREECWKQNVEGVENLVKACEQEKVHLIHLSTDFIFDGSHGPLTEEEPPNPVNYYGESKLAGEKIIQKSSCDWSIVRTVLVYGVTPDQSRSNIVLWVKQSLESGKAIQVVNDQWRTPTLAEDLAMGCLLVAKKKAKGIFNISGEGMMTPYDIATQTAAFFHLDKSLITPTDSEHFKQPARRPLKTGFIIEKAKRELGYRPRTFKEGLGVVAGLI